MDDKNATLIRLLTAADIVRSLIKSVQEISSMNVQKEEIEIYVPLELLQSIGKTDITELDSAFLHKIRLGSTSLYAFEGKT